MHAFRALAPSYPVDAAIESVNRAEFAGGQVI